MPRSEIYTVQPRELKKVPELRSCVLFLFQLQPEQLDCGAAHLQHPLSVLQPLKATPVFRAPGLSSVAVASVSNYTVVFLGTVSGRLLKVGLWVQGMLKEAGSREGKGGWEVKQQAEPRLQPLQVQY